MALIESSTSLDPDGLCSPPIVRPRVGRPEGLNKKPYQNPVLVTRMDGGDVETWECVVVEYSHQFSGSKLSFNFPRRSPSETNALADPVNENLAIVAVDVSVNRRRSFDRS